MSNNWTWFKIIMSWLIAVIIAILANILIVGGAVWIAVMVLRYMGVL